MEYFYIEPEVAGSIGDGTVMDLGANPPVIVKWHYQIEGWLGDAILESFPIFIITEEARRSLAESGVTGADFAEVDVTTTEGFRELYPNDLLPDLLPVFWTALRWDFPV